MHRFELMAVEFADFKGKLQSYLKLPEKEGLNMLCAMFGSKYNKLFYL